MKNLKNVILAMVFLFGMSFTADANAMVTKDAVSECISQSFSDYDFLLAFTGDADLAFQVSDDLLSDCLSEAGLN